MTASIQHPSLRRGDVENGLMFEEKQPGSFVKMQKDQEAKA